MVAIMTTFAMMVGVFVIVLPNMHIINQEI